MHEINEKPKRVERALLVGITLPEDSEDETQRLLDELEELVSTLGIEPVHRIALGVRKPRARFLLGPGNAQKIIDDAVQRECDVIVFDNELSPAQQRNWEAAGENKLLVIDRQEVILDIFADRAHTKEARLQVELARLEYNLPRLRRAWTHLNRQRGGGAVQRDAGETQLELDQRMVRTRISRLRVELDAVIRHRSVQRKRRQSIPVPTAAIVGYTNAGKSSLLNALCGASVLAEDKLFATLDPTSRRCKLPSGRPLVLTDTVGFVRNLPHGLVEAFKATLEEALVADFLIHVIDVTNPEALQHAATTERVLTELGAEDKHKITVFNKIDRLSERVSSGFWSASYPEACLVSAHTGAGLPVLLEHLEARVADQEIVLRLKIPHDRYDLVARLHREASVSREDALDDGTRVIASVPGRLLTTYEDYAEIHTDSALADQQAG